MTSVLRFLKQRPSDSQYFISLVASPVLSVFYGDAATSTNTYVSGAANGFFSSSTVTMGSDLSYNNLQIFRDMGVTIVSSMRTFRRVQLLTLDGGQSSTNNEWSAQATSSQQATPGVPGGGVWRGTTSTEGVYGGIPPSGTADSGFNVFYFETGANGLGIQQSLIRYG